MSINFLLITVGFLVTLTILVIEGQNEANFKRVECTVHDKTMLLNYSCKSKPINRYKTILNVQGYLARPVYAMMVHQQVFKKINVVYRPFLVNVMEDFCLRHVNRAKSPYLNIIMGIGEKYSNLNHSCPYEGLILIKDLELDLSSLRLLIPEGEYRYDIEPIVNHAKTPTYSIRVFWEIASRLKKRKPKLGGKLLY